MLEEDHEVGAETARRRVRRERGGSRADREDAAGRVHCEEAGMQGEISGDATTCLRPSVRGGAAKKCTD